MNAIMEYNTTNVGGFGAEVYALYTGSGGKSYRQLECCRDL